MRLRLEATPQELLEKGDALTQALAEEVEPHNPELADALQKAIPTKEPQLKFLALRQIKANADKGYKKAMGDMIGDIEDVLLDPNQAKKHLTKSEPFQKAEPREERMELGEEDKILKGEAAYVEHKGALYTCSECVFWLAHHDKPRCVKHGPNDITRAHGRCKSWTHGEPGTAGDAPTGEVTKELSLYRENPYKTGYKCNRCAHYVTPNQCRLVEGSIKLEATCALWEGDRKRGLPILKSHVEGGKNFPENVQKAHSVQGLQAHSLVIDEPREEVLWEDVQGVFGDLEPFGKGTNIPAFPGESWVDRNKGHEEVDQMGDRGLQKGAETSLAGGESASHAPTDAQTLLGLEKGAQEAPGGQVFLDGQEMHSEDECIAHGVRKSLEAVAKANPPTPFTKGLAFPYGKPGEDSGEIEFNGRTIKVPGSYAEIDATHLVFPENVQKGDSRNLPENVQKAEAGEEPEPKDEDPGAPPPDPDFDEESGEPKIDPESGLTPTELAEDKKQNPEAYEEPDDAEEGDTEKADTSEPLGHDHTKAVADADAKRYEQVKAELIQRGYPPSEFKKKGFFYGVSTNSLINFLENEKANNGGQ